MILLATKLFILFGPLAFALWLLHKAGRWVRYDQENKALYHHFHNNVSHHWIF